MTKDKIFHLLEQSEDLIDDRIFDNKYNFLMRVKSIAAISKRKLAFKYTILLIRMLAIVNNCNEILEEKIKEHNQIERNTNDYSNFTFKMLLNKDQLSDLSVSAIKHIIIILKQKIIDFRENENIMEHITKYKKSLGMQRIVDKLSKNITRQIGGVLTLQEPISITEAANVDVDSLLEKDPKSRNILSAIFDQIQFREFFEKKIDIIRNYLYIKKLLIDNNDKVAVLRNRFVIIEIEYIYTEILKIKNQTSDSTNFVQNKERLNAIAVSLQDYIIRLNVLLNEEDRSETQPTGIPQVISRLIDALKDIIAAIKNDSIIDAQKPFNLDKISSLEKMFGQSYNAPTDLFNKIMIIRNNANHSNSSFKELNEICTLIISKAVSIYDYHEDIEKKIFLYKDTVLGSVRIYIKHGGDRTLQKNNILDVSKTGNNLIFKKESIKIFDIEKYHPYEKYYDYNDSNYSDIINTITLRPLNSNVNIFGYGASGSGKTRTLKDLIKNIFNIQNAKYKIIELKEIYTTIDLNHIDYELTFMSTFNNQDIPGIYEKKLRDTLLKNFINKPEIDNDQYSLLEEAIKDIRIKEGRITRTINNKESSRSHLLIRLYDIIYNRWITIIDMGGSENIADTLNTSILELNYHEKIAHVNHITLYNELTQQTETYESARPQYSKYIQKTYDIIRATAVIETIYQMISTTIKYILKKDYIKIIRDEPWYNITINPHKIETRRLWNNMLHIMKIAIQGISIQKSIDDIAKYLKGKRRNNNASLKTNIMTYILNLNNSEYTITELTASNRILNGLQIYNRILKKSYALTGTSTGQALETSKIEDRYSIIFKPNNNPDDTKFNTRNMSNEKFIMIACIRLDKEKETLDTLNFVKSMD